MLTWQNTEDGHKGRNAPQPPALSSSAPTRESQIAARARAWRDRQSRSEQ